MSDPTVFTFTLDSFKITNTRSAHKDTDYVSFTLLVKSATGLGTPQTLTKSMGDVDNGTHAVGLRFSNVILNASDTVTLNYLIVNTGEKNGDQIKTALESAGAGLATKGATTGGAVIGGMIGTVIPIPLLGTLFGALAGAGVTWLAGKIEGWLHANCDGMVAAGQETLVYKDMVTRTDKGSFSETTKHPGSDSPEGCFSNSMYYVTWSMMSH